jgi:hypothetical protein
MVSAIKPKVSKKSEILKKISQDFIRFLGFLADFKDFLDFYDFSDF